MKNFLTQFKNLFTWNRFSKFLKLIEVIAVVAGVIFAGAQLRDIRNNQSAQFMLEFDKDLNSGTNLLLTEAIEKGEPLLKDNGGKFTTSDIDIYLSKYELLDATFEAGLIDNDMLYNSFSYDLVKTYENSEIKEYLVKIRKEDNLFFRGFEDLAISVKNANSY
jgi:hypothetical protein